jgi:hypothetical protein
MDAAPEDLASVRQAIVADIKAIAGDGAWHQHDIKVCMTTTLPIVPSNTSSKLKGFGGRMPLFLFIFHISITYIHTFIQSHSSVTIRRGFSPIDVLGTTLYCKTIIAGQH